MELIKRRNNRQTVYDEETIAPKIIIPLLKIERKRTK